ncbi:tumor necrosis factor receptor superfamily member 1B [Orycteropus afer afer]|uniref:Tumor necrosis factor receptor superfamily member 1B n=1 Tax=Orycteropus afer afer TaxID=1230840 RepID=A0AC54ZA06_ORYAF|nr:tumor necrosis factor receptor superfamily member 1B [Orycteropus afer afer]
MVWRPGASYSLAVPGPEGETSVGRGGAGTAGRRRAAGNVAPAALWAALAVGLQLWTAVLAQVDDLHGPMEALAPHAYPAVAQRRGARSAPSRATVSEPMLPPYAPEPGDETRCQPREYYDKRVQMCCSMCPPGQHVQNFCTTTSDTVCTPCEDNTYTELLNWVLECLSCDSCSSSDQVEVQACTRKQNRICACRLGWFCLLKRQEGCRLCVPLRKCPPGFGVAKPGTATSNVMCAPCAPGTFSNTASSTDTCKPHRTCSSVAIPGNASMDTVCGSLAPALTVSLGPAPTRNITLPIGLIVGVTALGLLIIVLVNCLIMTQRKKKPSCLHGEAKVPHLPADKARGIPGPEQQHLLTTAPSSSSSSLESSVSATDRRVPPRNQPQASGVGKASGAGEARASCVTSADPAPGSCGTQVNVTCIVNVCSSSDHGSQCPSQASSMTGNMDASPSGSPKSEQVPLSKEERPFQSHLGTLETLQQSSEEKPLPLGVPDVGMKTC